MRQIGVLTAAVFAVLGTVIQSQGLAEAWQGNALTQLDRVEREGLIYRVGADSYSGGYSGMSGADMKPGAASSPQGSTSGDRYRQTGDYSFSTPNSENRYGVNPSDNYLRKESSGPSGASNSPYGGAVYGGVPTTPSADPMIKELNRDPGMR